MKRRRIDSAGDSAYTARRVITLDETAVKARLRPRLRDPDFLRAVASLTNDRLLLSLFLMGVSYGEGLGEAGVAAIEDDEVARLMHDLRRQRLEEHGHADATRMVVAELFPEHFDGGCYRYEDHVFGKEYYFTVREQNRRRLRERDRYSRLNLYLTTTFGYEVMVDLFYGEVLEVLGRSTLPRTITARVEFVLTAILRQEETHLGLVEQHNALLATDRRTLSPGATATLDQLARVETADYEWAAERAVDEIVRAYAAYADADGVRARVAAP